jgi:HlyD family secretion protein
MRRLIALMAAAALVALIVWAFMPRPVAVELADIAPQTIEVTVEEEGQARIREVFTVSASIAGRLQRIRLHAGDPVVAGETVVAAIGPAAPALLDTRAKAVAEATVAAAEAAVDLARAQLDQAQATLIFLTGEAERTAELYKRSAVPKRMLDTALLEQRTAKVAVDSARASLMVRRRELESARAVLAAADAQGPGECCVELVAPVSGRVLRVLTQDEQVVQAGTPILEIGDPADLEVVVDLLSRDAVRVEPGAAATITGWGGPPLPATVERVEPSAATRVSALGIDEQRVEVVLRLDGDAASWRLLGHGYRVLARINLWRGEGVLAVPVGALFRDGSDWAAFVLHAGRAQLRPLTLGERSDTHAPVPEGLAAGERVILHRSGVVADATAETGAVPGE